MKTIREEKVGKSLVRILSSGRAYAGVVITNGKAGTALEDDDPDRLWRRLVGEVGKASPSYFGYDGAINRFLQMFPGGFDATFDAAERTYKLKAKATLDAALPLEQVGKVQGVDIAGVMRAVSQTNLLSPYEAMRVKDVLASPHGESFLAGAASLARGDVRGGLKAIEASFSKISRPSWPVATYLSYLWRPDHAMFLKPTVTLDFAERVGHSFAHTYVPDLEAAVYESLLELADEVRHEISRLQPRDLVDVQSFIWVVGAYQDDDAPQAD